METRPPENIAPRAVEGAFFFDPEDRIYADHFPGRPVVPGSVIIRAFMLAAKNLGAGGSARAVRDFRFRKFISPGEYPYRVEISGEGLKCSLFNDNSVVATGMLVL
ncbi:MAG: hypothetical protein WAW37_20430 [Syntrophobacteraceae bacterium]